MIPLPVVRLTISGSPLLMRRTPPVTNAPTHASDAMPENGVGRTNNASTPSTIAAAKYQRVLMRTRGGGGEPCSRASWAMGSIRLNLSAWSPTRPVGGAAARWLPACSNTYGSLTWAHRVLRNNHPICDRRVETPARRDNVNTGWVGRRSGRPLRSVADVWTIGGSEGAWRDR